MQTMKPIGDGELTGLRAAMAAVACDLDAVIKRDTSPTATGLGATSPGYSTIATTKGGMGEPTAGQLQAYGDRLGSLASWIVRFPYGTDVQRADIVEIGGHTLKVQRDLTPDSYALLNSVLASEI